MFQDTQEAIKFADNLGIKFSPIRGGSRTDSLKVEDPKIREALEAYGFNVNEITWYCSYVTKTKQ